MRKLAMRAQKAYPVAMDGAANLQQDDSPETAEARRRLVREAAMIEEARAQAAAGQTISLEAVQTWVDSWDTDHELPPPEPGP